MSQLDYLTLYRELIETLKVLLASSLSRRCDIKLDRASYTQLRNCFHRCFAVTESHRNRLGFDSQYHVIYLPRRKHPQRPLSCAVPPAQMAARQAAPDGLTSHSMATAKPQASLLIALFWPVRWHEISRPCPCDATR